MYQLIPAVGLMRMIQSQSAKKRRNPIVFVPGLFGSIGREIIPGAGEWGFGMAASVYEPFIQRLERMGYQKDKDLFISYYDWRKDCSFCAANYLMGVIDRAKTVTGSKKVDIICHSMGGLVSRAYAQSEDYREDIDQLIILGTPSAGAVNPYYLWSGGYVPYKGSVKADIFRTLLEGYLWIFEKYYNTPNDMEAIHEHFPGVSNLLPTSQYGEYLYYFDSKHQKNFIPYENIKWKNDFLEHLNQNEEILQQRNIRVTLIAGRNIETNQYLEVDPNYRGKEERWPEGKVVDVVRTLEGDGTVLLNSVFSIEGDKYILQSDHSGILYQCDFILRKKLGISVENMMRSSIEEDNSHISILVEGKGKLSIKASSKDGDEIIYDDQIQAEGLYAEKYREDLNWILLTNVHKKQIIMDFHCMEQGKLDILVKDKNGVTKKIQNRQVIKGNVYRMNLS